MRTEKKIQILSDVHTEHDARQAAKLLHNEVMIDANNRAYISVNLRDRIRKRLIQQDVSIAQTARALGMYCSALSNFLNGHRSIPFDKLEELFALLDM